MAEQQVKKERNDLIMKLRAEGLSYGQIADRLWELVYTNAITVSGRCVRSSDYCVSVATVKNIIAKRIKEHGIRHVCSECGSVRWIPGVPHG